MLSLGWKALIAVIFGVTIFIAGPVLAADTVKIVHIDPFSGPFKINGDRMYMATQFAVDEINAGGGLLGKRVELFGEDSQLKPDFAARKALKAVMQDGATVIMQNISTAVAQAIMNVAEKQKVVQVSHATYSDSLTGKDFNRIFFGRATRRANSPGLLRNTLKCSPIGNSISLTWTTFSAMPWPMISSPP